LEGRGDPAPEELLKRNGKKPRNISPIMRVKTEGKGTPRAGEKKTCSGGKRGKTLKGEGTLN